MPGCSSSKNGKRKVRKLENPKDSSNMSENANEDNSLKSGASLSGICVDDTVAETSGSNFHKNNSMCDDAEVICPMVDSEKIDQIVLQFRDKRAKASEIVNKIIKQSIKFSEHISQRMDADTSLAEEPKLFCGGKLMPYQKEGLQWLQTLHKNGLNGILADEMGLGKTVQVIAMIAYLIEMGVKGPFFVCAPLSVISNWHSELCKFTPDIPVVLYRGDKDHRKSLYSSFMVDLNNCKSKVLPVFIVTYDIMMIDFSLLSHITWKYLIIDEGHRVKNHKCKLFKYIKRYSFENMIFLTGTPLQNNLSELWSLLNIALPSIFNDMDEFESIIDVAAISTEVSDRLLASEEQKDHLITDLHQILTPFMLRRTKKEVGLEIPPKSEIIVYAPMMPLQIQYYDAVLKGNIRDLLEPKPTEFVDRKRKRKPSNYAVDIIDSDEEFDDPISNINMEADKSFSVAENKNNNRIHVTTNVQMMLRQICMHPYLLSCPTVHNTGVIMKVDEKLVQNCGKLKILDVMLPELKKRGHKVLIFSQMVRMLEILIEYCCYRKFNHQVLIGNMNLEDRNAEISEFNSNPKSFVFLISTKAGGLGINLTSADTVIIYDSDWNPQNDLQAQDRCHRIGQVREVAVYRLITIHSIEEVIINRANAKRKLEKLVIKDGRFSSMDTLTKRQELLPEKEILQLFHSCNAQKCIEGKDVISKLNLNLLLDRSNLTAGHQAKRDVDGVFKTVH